MVAFLAAGRVFVIVFGLETGDDDLFDRLLDQLLDVDQVLHLVRRDQRHCRALTACAAGAADAVHVVLGRVRQLEVDDVRQFVNVQTACGDVGGDEDQRRAVLECFERLQTVLLALVTVDGVGLDPGALQFARQTPGF